MIQEVKVLYCAYGSMYLDADIAVSVNIGLFQETKFMITNGVDYQIAWQNFLPGTSIFLPVIDTKAAIAAMKSEAKRLEFEFVYKVVVEDGVKGLRCWRL